MLMNSKCTTFIASIAASLALFGCSGEVIGEDEVASDGDLDTLESALVINSNQTGTNTTWSWPPRCSTRPAAAPPT
jgi:hypothetical protein